MALSAIDFRALVDGSPDVVAVLDREHRYIYVNAAIEKAAGVAASEIIGKRNDEVVAPEAREMWREALDHVMRTGEPRTIERTVETPRGSRRINARLTMLSTEHVCAVTRDITDAHAARTLDEAVGVMPFGMCIAEAPSGRIVFANDQLWRLFDVAPQAIRSIDDYPRLPLYGEDHQLIANVDRPLARALRGQTITRERVYIHDDRGRRAIDLSASPVRDSSGAVIAAVTTYHDVTDAVRTAAAARYLADASARLEQFDPRSSLQAILDLAVPSLADVVFIHLVTAGAPVLAAGTHVDAEMHRFIQARVGQSEKLSDDTAVARVLAGGPAELVIVDDAVLRGAAQDDAHLAALRMRGYRYAAVVPLVGREGVLGAITFSLTRPGRTYDKADLAILGELARRTGVALENHRLFLAEQDARRRAEAARDRTRRLQELTARLSGALDAAEVAQILVSTGSSALGAAAGFAWLLRNDGMLELVAAEHRGAREPVDPFRSIPLSDHLPVCDVVKTARPLLFESFEAMAIGYPGATTIDGKAYRAWAVIPFVVSGAAIGAASFSFPHERSFSEDERELMVAMTGQASLALERCKLLEAERRARTQAEAARLREQHLHLTAARLSRALTVAEVGAVIAQAGSEACGSYAATAALRVDDTLRIVGSHGSRNPALLARVATVPVSAGLPVAECVRVGDIVWAGTPAEMAKRWPSIADMMSAAGIRSCGAAPFSFEGRIVGALGFACDEDRLLSAADREQLTALSQLAAQAFERARLYEQLQAREEQLRTALAAARAGTWSVNLRTMKATRDASYADVLALRPDEEVHADFGGVHPEDIAIARSAFERTLREDVPYEPEVRVKRGDGRYVWTRSYARMMRGADGQPDVLTGLVFDIDEKKQAELRAEAERRINDTLYQIAVQFARELDPQKLAQMIVDELTRLVGAETGVFYGEDGGELATTGEHPASNEAQSRFSVPLATGGKTLGMVVLTHRAAGKFTEQHERLALSVATQAAVALENARLYRTVRSQNDELELAIDRAQVADRRKDEFLAMLGHELRNP
ncbi:MAG: GAF domain-containing protein, partial [Deltaproteobacteria bacterium]|nr:GAF domain-containing protein [Deltaproteobacteria bacterium]